MTSETLAKEKRKLYMAASALSGANSWQIFYQHTRRALVPSLLVVVLYQLPILMVFESFFSFAGVGFQSPQLSLGMILADAWSSFVLHPHLFFLPASVLAFFVILIPNFAKWFLRLDS